MRLVLVVAYAVALGHLAWYGIVGPTAVPQYRVGGSAVALCGKDPQQRHLYLRRELFLTRLPRHAWLQVVGRDKIKVYVNGRFLASQALSGWPVAVVDDPGPYFQVGKNVIAIVAEQCSLGQPPVVAVDGAFSFDDQTEHRIEADELWRCATVFDRRGAWWFETQFDDRRWPFATLTSCDLSATVNAPPRATTEPGVGQWITPAVLEEASAGLRREVEIAERPSQAWLRVTATGSYRLAVNGILIDQQEAQLGATVMPPAARRSYDITSVVSRGRNVLALVLTGTAGFIPHLLIDAEIQDFSGQRWQLGSDGAWLSCAGLPADWQALAPRTTAAWKPCRVEAGDLLVPPWEPRRQPVEVSLPFEEMVWRLLAQIGLMATVAMASAVACALAWNYLGGQTACGIVYLALVPPTLAIAVAVLACYDPRIDRQDVYRPLWVWAALGCVPLQWCLLALLRRPTRCIAVTIPSPHDATTCCSARRGTPAARAEQGGLAAGTPLQRAARGPIGSRFVDALRRPAGWVAALVLIGLFIRLRDVGIEGLQWDEAENYHATLGFLERGFPSIKVHDDLPPMYIHTSELQFVPMALAALVFSDSEYVVRLPSVCWGTLTIWLIYLVGRRLFVPAVGVLAAAVYTFAPVCIGMSNFGRYFSQLQFFTLLSVYYFWMTLRGAGPINRRALWMTVISFVCMFLTWEASALVAPGMVLAALVQRRGRLRSILGVGAVWAAILVVGSVVLAQTSHVILQQTKFLWYGVSISDVKLIPMWRYPIPGVFQPWYYIWQASWNQDALLPILGLLAAGVLAVRHAFRGPARFLLLIHLTTCLLMAFLLPNTQWRYIHHMVPLPILLGSAALVAASLGLIRVARRQALPRAWLAYAQGLAVLFGVVPAGLASGMVLQLRDAPGFRIEAHGRMVYKFPNLQGASLYLRDHLCQGDVVLANNVYQVNHLMGIVGRPNRPLDFMPATGPFLPATLDDCRPLLLDRRDGVKVISTPEAMVDLFARYPRIWYVVQPGQHHILNTPDVSTFLRQHMDVVYEDFEAIVLFRGENHRPAALRVDNERALRDSQANYLP